MGDTDETVADRDASNGDQGPDERDAIAAFLDLATLPLLDDSDPKEAATHLTPPERDALSRLGSPEELVRGILAEIEGRDIQAEKATRMENQTHLSTRLNSPQDDEPVTPEFDAFMERHRECTDNLHGGWSTEYVRGKKLGSGGQGDVYRVECEDDFSGSRALKIYSPEPYRAVAPYLDDMERMRAVASLVHRIQHYNLVEVAHFEPDGGIFTMAMRLIDGLNLQELLRTEKLASLRQSVKPQRWSKLNQVVYAAPGKGQHSPKKWGLQPGMAVNIIEKCLRGVCALHDNGIVHGDIKPSNIMLGRDGSIRLVDIGSAFELAWPPQEAAWWSPRYAPPEVLDGRRWSPQSDLASLGYVLVELLSGQPSSMGPVVSSKSTRTTADRSYPELFDAKMRLPEQMTELLPEPARESELLVELCLGLTHPDPQKRTQSARDALRGKRGDSGIIPFKEQLVKADLAVDWVEEIENWVDDMKKAVG